MKQFLKIFPLCLILAITIFVTPAEATSVYDLPSLDTNTWVIDQAEVISRANEGKLSSELNDLANNTGNQVRIVTIRRLDYDSTIDTFADALFSYWFPTTETQTNQTLLVLDTVTNNSAIRTGEAVKNILPDAIAQSIAIDNIGVPLREGNKYNEAFLGASDRLVAILSGNPDPGAPVIADNINTEGTFTKAEDTKKGSATVWVIALLIAATVIPMATYFLYVGFPGN